MSPTSPREPRTQEFKREILRLALSMFALVCGEGHETPKEEVIQEVLKEAY